MLAWFTSIAILGVRGIASNPAVLTALNLRHAVEFFLAHPWRSFIALGAVVLVVTGGEALYGHGSLRSEAYSDRGVLLRAASPAAQLSGQGALLLRSPEAIANPFYLLAPSFVYPLLVIATSAAVVASQALISGAFSSRSRPYNRVQSAHADHPHLEAGGGADLHSGSEQGARRPARSSSSWLRYRNEAGAAYGVAVSGTMAITSILFFMVVRHRRVGRSSRQGRSSHFSSRSTSRFSSRTWRRYRTGDGYRCASRGWSSRS
jgi:KUP system potassium uptake protein